MLVVFQDGQEFYSLDPSVSNPIYIASVKVRDFDLRAANEARESFKNHMREAYPTQEWRWGRRPIESKTNSKI